MNNELIDSPGFLIIRNIIPTHLLDNLLEKQNEFKPVRASASDHTYAEKEDIKKLKNIAVYWTQDLSNWNVVQEIEKVINPIILKYFTDAIFYGSDVVVISAESKWINPHIDTPHRFKKFNYDRRLLGIQTLIPLFDLDENFAATGLVPNSHKKDFSISLCYQGFYNTYFKENCIQPKLNKGDVLIFNARTLHSSMPNSQPVERPALLINYIDKNIMEEIKIIDNVWKSNE